jgi:outer membrane receptor protein involved in Fe transport
MSSYSKTTARVLVGAAVAAALSGTAYAQAQLEEITVTARKTKENLQDVPLTITAFSAETIERSNIRNVQDVVKYTPGLNYDKGFAPQDTRISIRGLPVVRGKPPVGVLLDGIDISSESISTAGGSALVNVKLVELQQIEVVKGPQSALYGRSAFGGAVVYTSKRPNLEKVEGNASLEVASDSMYEGRAAVSFPLVQDKVAVRVNAVYSDFDGFYKNTNTGNTIGGNTFVGGSVALRFKPTDSADFTLRASYSDDKIESRPSYYIGTANGRTVSRALPANAVGLRLGLPPGGAPLVASWLFPTIGTVSTAGNAINISVDPLTGKDFEAGRLKPFVVSLVGDVDLGFAKLSSWTGYTSATSFGRADADFFAAPTGAVTVPSVGTAETGPVIFITDIKVKAKQFSQEIRLGNDEGKLRWGVGALYWQERYDSGNASLSSARSAPRPANFSAARAYQVLGQAPFAANARDTDHRSIYGSIAYDFTDRIEGSVEARYAQEDVDSLFGPALNLVASVAAPTPLFVFGASPLNPTPSYSTNIFTPRAVLKYNFENDANVYLSYAKGKKPGGYLNVGVVADTKLARYNPEQIDTIELGFKSTWLDKRLRLNGAVFQSVNKDRLNQVLIPDATSPQGVVTQAVNVGEVKIDGLEFDMTAALTDHITANLAYTYLDARYTSSDAPQTTAFAVAAAGNCTVGTVGPQTVCITNTNGNQLDFSSKHSASASLAYTTEINSDWNLISSIDAQYRSKRFLDATNLFALPSYVSADLRITAESEKYGVTLFVSNLTDDDKPKSGQTSGDNYTAVPPQLAYTLYAPDPRQYGLRFSVKF